MSYLDQPPKGLKKEIEPKKNRGAPKKPANERSVNVTISTSPKFLELLDAQGTVLGKTRSGMIEAACIYYFKLEI